MNNEEQNTFIKSEAKRIRLTAGPGSGKTRCIIERIKRIPSHEIDGVVVVTFTVKAAKEVKDRLSEEGVEHPGFIGTWHALCLYIIQGKAGQEISVMEEEEEDKAWREWTASSGLKIKEKPSAIIKRMDEVPRRHVDALEVFAREMVRRKRSVGFAGMQALAIREIKNDNGAIHIMGGNRVSVMMIDEAQDSSVAECRMLEAIKCETKIIIGDVMQQIFLWRGAYEHALEAGMWSDDEWEEMRLTSNYRSSPEIVAFGEEIREGYGDGMKATLVMEVPGAVDIRKCGSLMQPLEECAEIVKAEAIAGRSVAILCRLNEEVGMVKNHLGIEIKDRREDEAMMLMATEIEVIASMTPEERLKDAIAARFHKGRESRMLWKGMRAGIDITKPSEWMELAAGQEDGMVYIGTVHGAKGGEWDTVVIPFADQSSWGGMSPSKEMANAFYVAATRAKTRLVIMHTGNPTPIIQ